MKKLLSLALAALAVTSAMATDVTFDFNSVAGLRNLGITKPADGKTTLIANPIVYQGVTMTPLTSQVGVYNDDDDLVLQLNAIAANGVQKFKLSVDEGYVIKAIEFKFNTPSQLNKLGFDSGSYTEGREDLTPTTYVVKGYWTGEAQEVEVGTKGAGVVPGGSTQITYRTWIDNFIVTYEEAPVTGVEGVEAGQQVKSVRYYNLSGAQSATPFDGVNIVVKEMADGSRTTTKVIR